MQYILMVYVNEAGWFKLTQAEQEQGVAAYNAYTEALRKVGVLTGANRLQASSAATTVRVANGKSQVLDGPYADSKEQLGGYGSRQLGSGGAASVGPVSRAMASGARRSTSALRMTARAA
jgi:hypothetical protein